MKHHLNKILWTITALAILVALAAVYVTGQREKVLRDELNAILKIRETAESINVKQPKDGKDASMEQVRKAVTQYIASNPPKNGRNATDEQVSRAVEDYFVKYPMKTPKDGKTPVKGEDYEDGEDGRTPQIKCNVLANRWEVRYSKEDNWQLLNGEKVSCTIGSLQWPGNN